MELGNVVQTWKSCYQRLKIPDHSANSNSSPLELFFSLELKLAKKLTIKISSDLTSILTIPESVKKEICSGEVPDSCVAGASINTDFNSVEDFLKNFASKIYKLSEFSSKMLKNLKPGFKVDLGVLLRPTAFLQQGGETS